MTWFGLNHLHQFSKLSLEFIQFILIVLVGLIQVSIYF